MCVKETALPSRGPLPKSLRAAARIGIATSSAPRHAGTNPAGRANLLLHSHVKMLRSGSWDFQQKILSLLAVFLPLCLSLCRFFTQHHLQIMVLQDERIISQCFLSFSVAPAFVVVGKKRWNLMGILLLHKNTSRLFELYRIFFSCSEKSLKKKISVEKNYGFLLMKAKWCLMKGQNTWRGANEWL